MELKRQRITASAEKKIITGLIVSTRFIKEVGSLLAGDYFESKYTRVLTEWCLDFFDRYEKAPFNHIQDIFNKRKSELAQDDIKIVEDLLVDISNRYELDSGINVDFYVDEALLFVKTRELEITSSNVEFLLAKGKVEEAEEQLHSYKKAARVTSPWYNPFDEKAVDKTFEYKEDGGVLEFPGVLGRFLGPMRAGWLVGVEGAYKRGKTWLLQEAAINAVLDRRKAVLISLEMREEEMNTRVYKRLQSAPDEGGMKLFPCFDCDKNQIGTCRRPERTNNVLLYEEGGEKPDFDPRSRYRPCTACRTGRNREEYEIATWWEEIPKQGLSYERTQPFMKHMDEFYGRYLRMISYPRFSANYSDIKRDLSLLEFTEGFIPELIVVDYADILSPDTKGATGISKEDETWANLGRLANEYKALVFTGTQITKEGQDAQTIQTKHTARWSGKLGHVDSMLTLNQTEQEKNYGIMRVAVKYHRHKDCSPERQCTVLQAISAGQVHLDSEL